MRVSLSGLAENKHTDKTPVLSLINAETGEVRRGLS